MKNIIDYCKGRLQFALDNGVVALQYKFDFSNNDFYYGIDLEIEGDIGDVKDLREIESYIRASLPTTHPPIFDAINQLIGEYFDEPKKFDNEVVFRLGQIEP